MRLLLLVIITGNLWGTARTWTGLGADANWSTTANWNPSGTVVAADTLTFNNTCTNCASTIDANITITSLTVASTYPGTITSAVTLTVSGGFTFSGGALTWTGGTLTFSGSGQTVTCAGNLKTASGLTAITSTMAVGTLTVASTCALDFTTIAAGVSISVGSTAAVNGPASSAFLALTNSGTFTATNLSVTSVTTTGTLTLTGGTLTMNGSGGTISCAGNLKAITGLSTIALSSPSGTLAISSTCVVDANTIGTNTSLNVGASATVNAPATATLSALTNSGTFTGTDLSVTSLTTTGTLTLTGGTLTVRGSGSTISCAGNLKAITGLTTIAVTQTVGTMTISSTCVVDVDTVGSAIDYNIGASARLNLPNTTIASLTNAGTFAAGSGTLAVTTNWNNTGTFVNSGGTVVFSDNSHNVIGSTTFNNLTMTATAITRTVTFTAGTTQTVTGTLTLTGTTGKLLLLRSSSTPSVWNINASGAKAVTFVDVKDSTATTAIYAGVNSVNSGGNTNWFFTAPPASGPKHSSSSR